MTYMSQIEVMPAKAGIRIKPCQALVATGSARLSVWVPAFAGRTIAGGSEALDPSGLPLRFFAKCGAMQAEQLLPESPYPSGHSDHFTYLSTRAKNST
jgi:hypothetical protein